MRKSHDFSQTLSDWLAATSLTMLMPVCKAVLPMKGATRFNMGKMLRNNPLKMLPMLCLLHASTVEHWHFLSILIQVIVLVSLPVVVATILSTFHYQKYAGLFPRK